MYQNTDPSEGHNLVTIKKSGFLNLPRSSLLSTTRKLMIRRSSLIAPSIHCDPESAATTTLLSLFVVFFSLEHPPEIAPVLLVYSTTTRQGSISEVKWSTRLLFMVCSIGIIISCL